MTSKKALKAINKSLDFIQMKFGVLLYKKEWINAIKQDLKVLEILKHYTDTDNYDGECSINELICSKGQYQKVKEWLEK